MFSFTFLTITSFPATHGSSTIVSSWSNAKQSQYMIQILSEKYSARKAFWSEIWCRSKTEKIKQTLALLSHIVEQTSMDMLPGFRFSCNTNSLISLKISELASPCITANVIAISKTPNCKGHLNFLSLPMQLSSF